MKRSAFFFFSFYTFFSVNALAFPINMDIDFDLQDAGFTSDYNFEGILGLSGCSGSLVRYDDSRDSDNAIVLTNGHCVGTISPNKVIVNRSSSASFSVLDSMSNKIGTLRSKKILFATMTHTDMALYELRTTYEEIYNRYGIEPFTLSRSYAEIGTEVEVISGYWKRGYSCHIEAIVHRLKEDKWVMKDSLRYSRPGCNVIGGTSGSPVIEVGTKIVIAVNNTGNQSGRRCTMNNPCEIDESGNVTYKKGFGYAQQISWVYGCRDVRGKINLNIRDCKLKP